MKGVIDMNDERMMAAEFATLNEDQKKQVLSFIETLKKRSAHTTNSLKSHPTFNPTEPFI